MKSVPVLRLRRVHMMLSVCTTAVYLTEGFTPPGQRLQLPTQQQPNTYRRTSYQVPGIQKKNQQQQNQYCVAHTWYI